MQKSFLKDRENIQSYSQFQTVKYFLLYTLILDLKPLVHCKIGYAYNSVSVALALWRKAQTPQGNLDISFIIVYVYAFLYSVNTIKYLVCVIYY